MKEPFFEPHFRRLRAYIAICEAGTLYKASEQVHLAPSSLTRMVQELERTLAVELFERTGRRMVPTESGRVLAAGARRILAYLDEAEQELEAGENTQAEPPRLFSHRLTHRQLRALIDVARHHSMSEAARQQKLSQPAVAMAIRDLEQVVETPLFYRTSSGMTLTEQGEVLLRYAKLAFAESNAIADEISARSGELDGRVVIGALPQSGALLIPRAVNMLLTEHPKLRVSVMDGTYDALLQGLLCGEVDIIVGGLRFPVPEEIRYEQLFVDKLVCVVRSSHPLAQRTGRLEMRHAQGFEWVIPRRGTPAREQVDAMLARAQVGVGNQYIESNSLHLIRGLLMESDRVAIISQCQVQLEVEMGMLTILPLVIHEGGTPIGIRTRAVNEWPIGTQKLISCLRQVSGGLNSMQR